MELVLTGPDRPVHHTYCIHLYHFELCILRYNACWLVHLMQCVHLIYWWCWPRLWLITLVFFSECCICTRLEIKDPDQLIYFHPDSDRMTKQARDFLTLLQKINPGLCLPKQTSCICLQCLSSLKSYLDEVECCFMRTFLLPTQPPKRANSFSYAFDADLY